MAVTKNVAPEQESKEQRKPPELVDIKMLAEKHKLGPVVFIGICAANRWQTGKCVTEAEFDKAVADFLNRPIAGRSKK